MRLSSYLHARYRTMCQTAERTSSFERKSTKPTWLFQSRLVPYYCDPSATSTCLLMPYMSVVLSDEHCFVVNSLISMTGFGAPSAKCLRGVVRLLYNSGA